MTEYKGKIADVYLKHVDPDLEFTDEQMLQWGTDGPLPWVEQRIAELCAMHRVVYKRNKQLTGVTLATWWVKAEAVLRQLLRIYPQNFNPALPVVTDEEMGLGTLPDPKTKEGKALTLAARELDGCEWDWSHTQKVLVVDQMVWVASMQEKQSDYWGWDRTKNSNGNKLMNKFENHELKQWNRLVTTLKSRQDRS